MKKKIKKPSKSLKKAADADYETIANMLEPRLFCTEFHEHPNVSISSDVLKKFLCFKYVREREYKMSIRRISSELLIPKSTIGGWFKKA